MKVYVVLQDEYADFSDIAGVFSDPEKAKACINNAPKKLEEDERICILDTKVERDGWLVTVKVDVIDDLDLSSDRRTFRYRCEEMEVE